MAARTDNSKGVHVETSGALCVGFAEGRWRRVQRGGNQSGSRGRGAGPGHRVVVQWLARKVVGCEHTTKLPSSFIYGRLSKISWNCTAFTGYRPRLAC